jgi:S-phase kinase-associated protein 1
MVVLTSSDSVSFTVSKEVAERSVLIKNLLEDVGESDQPIPLPNVTSKVLEKVNVNRKAKKHMKLTCFAYLGY